MKRTLDETEQLIGEEHIRRKKQDAEQKANNGSQLCKLLGLQ